MKLIAILFSIANNLSVQEVKEKYFNFVIIFHLFFMSSLIVIFKMKLNSEKNMIHFILFSYNEIILMKAIELFF